MNGIVIRSPAMPRGVNVTRGRVIWRNQGIFNSFNFFTKFELRYTQIILIINKSVKNEKHKNRT